MRVALRVRRAAVSGLLLATLLSPALLIGCLPFGSPARPQVPPTDGFHVDPFRAQPLFGGTVALLPASGPVNSSVSASGTGFPGNTTISLYLDGLATATNCSTDSTGDFPGTSGSNCTFRVPPVPGGNETVVASDGVSTSIPAAPNPYGIAYDAGRGELYVADWGSNTVNILSDSNNSDFGSVTVGTTPVGVAYDPAKGEIFVADQASNAVSVLADSNNTVVATVGVGSDPLGIAYDPHAGEVFVANSVSNTVSVINDTNDTVVATVGVGSAPYFGVSYDSALHEVLVGNYGSNNVSVIDDTNSSVIASIGVGSNPFGLAYDPVLGETVVSNLGSDNVSVISDGNDTVVASVGVGTSPVGLAYDPASAEFYVANDGSANVSLVAAANDTVIATLAVGASPTDASYDAGHREVFIPNFNSNNVSVFALGDAVDSSFHVNSSLALVPTSGVVGSMVAAKGTGFGANRSITFVFASGIVASSCSSDGTGVFPGASATPCTFVVPPSAPTGPIVVTASDGNMSANSTFTAAPSLALSPPASTIGSTVFAVGSRFSTNSTITLTLGGTTLPFSCATDPNGSFPGQSGTSCSFVVPTGIWGKGVVAASDGTHVAEALLTIRSNLTLSPDFGTVGTLVNLTGSGVGPNASINYSVAGHPVPSNCVSNGTGGFPATTGTPCSLHIPEAPGGPVSVLAYSGWNLSGIGGGSLPYGVIFDPGTRDWFIANVASSNVTVIDGDTESVLATIAVGSDPYELAYDSARSEVFVANYGSSNVSVISDSSDSVVANVAVGSNPYGVAYDSARGEVFVANQGSGNVSIISDANDTVVGNVAVGGSDYNLVVVPAVHSVYVANYGSNNVSVISDVSNTLTATIAVGSNPYALAYDPSAGEVDTTNYGSNNVSLISVTTNRVAIDVGVGSGPAGITVSTATGQVFVSDTNSNQVSVISDTNQTDWTTAPVGGSPRAITDTGAQGLVFAVNFGSNNVSILSASSGSVLGSLPVGNSPQGGIAYDPVTDTVLVPDYFSGNNSLIRPDFVASSTLTVNASLALPGVHLGIDAGQPVHFQGEGFGSLTTVSTLAIGTTELVCAAASVGTCVGGVLTTDFLGSASGTIVVPTGTIPGAYSVRFTDSLGNTASASLTVYADPNVTVVSASVGSLDLGQSVTLSVGASLGSGGYTYSWSGLPAGCRSTLPTFVCTPSGAGDFSISVDVTDSSGDSVRSSPLSYVVFSDPTATQPRASAVSAAVDATQSVTFTTQESSGTGNYTSVQWYGLPNGCLGSSAAVTCSGSALAAGNYVVTATVTDSNNWTSVSSPGLAFEVLQEPSVSVPVASAPSIDLGEGVNFSATPYNGSGSFTYNWSGLPTGCTGTVTAVVTCKPAVAGTFAIGVIATDTNGFSVTSAGLRYTVYADPVVQLTADHPVVDSGRWVNFSATVSLGSGQETYAWHGLPTGCAADSARAVCRPATPGSFGVYVVVTDGNRKSVPSPVATITVAPALTAVGNATPSTSSVGQAIAFLVTPSGGTGNRSVDWVFGDGSRATGSSTSHAFTSEGTYKVTAWINDTGGGVVRLSLPVSVTPVTAATGSHGTGSQLLDYLVAAGASVAVALIAWTAVRRRRRSPEAEPAPEPDESLRGEPGPGELETPEESTATMVEGE